jgi:hypothetical protein
MTTVQAKRLAYGVAILALSATSLLDAQIGLGTWVRKATASVPSTTMTSAACCGGGRRLTYHAEFGGKKTVLTVESPFDGSDAPVLLDGKPSGETMAIKWVGDKHNHVSTVVKMNGKQVGTSEATLSEDGVTLTIVHDFSDPTPGQPAGKYTEVWELQ